MMSLCLNFRGVAPLLAASIFLATGLMDRAQAAVTVSMQNTYSATASGTLNGSSFTTSFTITGNYSSAAIETVSVPLHLYSVDFSSCFITLAGIGTFEITTPLRTFVTGSIVGLSRATQSGNDLTDLGNIPQIGAWNMDSSTGPIVKSGSLIQWALAPQIQTTGGTLIMGDQPTTLTFTATVVPEASVSAAAALAAGALALRRRRASVG